MYVLLRHASIVAMMVSLFSGCGSKSNPNTPPPTTNPPPGGANPTVSSVAVTGGNSVTVGQTVQFSATASMSNNTTQSVSSTAAWSSSNTGIATVSASGLATGVAAGSAEIRAAFQNVTGSATLQVNAAAPVAPVAQFTVSGPGGNDVCRIIEGSGGDFDCTFNGSASTGGSGGAVTQWVWRYDVGTNSAGPVTDDEPTLKPSNLCGFLDDKPSQSGTGFVQMIVKLQVRNASGTLSAETRNSNVRLFPQKQCGFTF